MSTRPELWQLHRDGLLHDVEISETGWHRRVVWRVDGETVAEAKTSDERFALAAPGHGSVGMHFRMFAGTRRVTWFEHTSVPAALAASKMLVGGLDFEPEPGSKAARRLAWMHRHPRLYTARQISLAAIAVAAGVLATWLFSRLVALIPWHLLPRIDWPDIPWPDIPWPDIRLPRIPWPEIDWPTIPWPDLPDLELPGWVGVVANAAKFVVPVAFAGWLAMREVRRRRQVRRRASAPSPDPTREIGSVDVDDRAQSTHESANAGETPRAPFKS